MPAHPTASAPDLAAPSPGTRPGGRAQDPGERLAPALAAMIRHFCACFMPEAEPGEPVEEGGLTPARASPEPAGTER